MKIRLGYVAISKDKNNTTPNGLITYTYYQKLSLEKRKEKLYHVTKRNIEALRQLILYNIEHNIHFFRITSSLIPLATHPDVMWDFSIFHQELRKVGNIIKQANMRVDMHPDQFNVLNSVHPHVVENTFINLEYHHKVLDLMGLDDALLIIHVGSKTRGKEEAKRRFLDNFRKLPRHLKKRIIIENDDKVYHVDDVIELSQKLDIPIVYDYHHDKCNPVEKVENKIKFILNTWKENPYKPKVHLSSPKTHPLDRHHADYITTSDFKGLVNLLKVYQQDIDVMIEAKMKDFALFKLMEDIKNEKEFETIDKSTILVK